MKFLQVLVALSLYFAFNSCSKESPTVPDSNQNGKGELALNSNPQGAEIFLQGTFTGKTTPDTIYNLSPDSYDIRLQLQFSEYTFSTNVKADLVTTEFIDFSQFTGNIFFNSEPLNAQIIIDAINTGKVTPDTIFYLSEGTHLLKLIFPNGEETVSNFITQKGVTLTVDNTIFGEVHLESDPSNAEIWLDGSYTNVLTPGTIPALVKGEYNVTLKLNGFFDTTFVMNVNSGATSSKFIFLKSLAPPTHFGPVRIYETLGTTADQRSGLDLSSGFAYGITSSDKDKVDIYYSSNGYLVKSADLASGLTRVTAFLVSGAADLYDGIDSPLRSTGNWLDNMSDRENHYVYLYDNDGHYSKLKIVSWGGGVLGEPSWIEVEWLYNENSDNTSF